MEDELPGVLIREILKRLPARLLLKLKSVCRSWNSLISSHEFALHHLQQRTPTQSRPLLCWNHGIREKENENDNHEDYDEWIHCNNIITTDTIMHSRYFINYKQRKQRRAFYTLFDSLTIDDYTLFNSLMIDDYTFFDSLPIDGAKGIIRGSCNGLLCLSDSGFPFHTLTLFNPTTRSVSPSLTFQCPRPIPHPSLDPNYPQQNTLFWGFGYDSLRDKYKFLIDCCNSSPSSSWSSGAIVCTFGGASKTVDHPAFQYHIYGSDGIFFNGTLN